ncbi:MAG: hypothetical protein HY548_04350, partial [Elusimicrobia bacterium]|nr:hypothetical protein [Elusimicrobiota bacterium]
ETLKQATKEFAKATVNLVFLQGGKVAAREGVVGFIQAAYLTGHAWGVTMALISASKNAIDGKGFTLFSSGVKAYFSGLKQGFYFHSAFVLGGLTLGRAGLSLLNAVGFGKVMASVRGSYAAIMATSGSGAFFAKAAAWTARTVVLSGMGGIGMVAFSTLNRFMSSVQSGQNFQYSWTAVRADFLFGFAATFAYISLKSIVGYFVPSASTSSTTVGFNATSTFEGWVNLAKNPYQVSRVSAVGAWEFAKVGPSFFLIGSLFKSITHGQVTWEGKYKNGLQGFFQSMLASSLDMALMGLWFKAVSQPLHNEAAQAEASVAGKQGALEAGAKAGAESQAQASLFSRMWNSPLNQAMVRGPFQVSAFLAIVEGGVKLALTANDFWLYRALSGKQGTLDLGDEGRDTQEIMGIAGDVGFAVLMFQGQFMTLGKMGLEKARGAAIERLVVRQYAGREQELYDAYGKEGKQVNFRFLGRERKVDVTGGMLRLASERLGVSNAQIVEAFATSGGKLQILGRDGSGPREIQLSEQVHEWAADSLVAEWMSRGENIHDVNRLMDQNTQEVEIGGTSYKVTETLRDSVFHAHRAVVIMASLRAAKTEDQKRSITIDLKQEKGRDIDPNASILDRGTRKALRGAGVEKVQFVLDASTGEVRLKFVVEGKGNAEAFLGELKVNTDQLAGLEKQIKPENLRFQAEVRLDANGRIIEGTLTASGQFKEMIQAESTLDKGKSGKLAQKHSLGLEVRISFEAGKTAVVTYRIVADKGQIEALVKDPALKEALGADYKILEGLLNGGPAQLQKLSFGISENGEILPRTMEVEVNHQDVQLNSGSLTNGAIGLLRLARPENGARLSINGPIRLVQGRDGRFVISQVKFKPQMNSLKEVIRELTNKGSPETDLELGILLEELLKRSDIDISHPDAEFTLLRQPDGTRRLYIKVGDRVVEGFALIRAVLRQRMVEELKAREKASLDMGAEGLQKPDVAEGDRKALAEGQERLREYFESGDGARYMSADNSEFVGLVHEEITPRVRTLESESGVWVHVDSDGVTKIYYRASEGLSEGQIMRRAQGFTMQFMSAEAKGKVDLSKAEKIAVGEGRSLEDVMALEYYRHKSSFEAEQAVEPADKRIKFEERDGQIVFAMIVMIDTVRGIAGIKEAPKAIGLKMGGGKQEGFLMGLVSSIRFMRAFLGAELASKAVIRLGFLTKDANLVKQAIEDS